MILLLLSARLVHSQIDSSNITTDYNKYNNELDSQFSMFLKVCESDSVIKLWQQKNNVLIYNTKKVIEEIEATKKYYQNSKVEIYSFLYLRTVNTYELERKTALVNELGHYLLRKRLNESNFEQRFNSIEEKFNKYSNTESAKLYYSEYIKFNNLKYELGKIEYPPIKLQLNYEAREHAYQMNPEIFTYKLLNWQTQINRIVNIEENLDKIELGIKNTSFLIPKDKTSWITLLIQIVILGTLIPTFLLTYKVSHSPKLVLIVVFSSIALSFVLIFFNPTTWQNIVFGAIIPGLFYIYYHIKLKGRINGDRISYPFKNQTKVEIKHNFGYTPHVSVYDENDEIIICDVHSNEKVSIVEASIKITGRVELS